MSELLCHHSVREPESCHACAYGELRRVNKELAALRAEHAQLLEDVQPWIREAYMIASNSSHPEAPKFSDETYFAIETPRCYPLNHAACPTFADVKKLAKWRR